MGARVGVADVRAELRAWLAQSWEPSLSLVAWRTRLADAGWARPSWPLAWCGRDLPASYNDLVEEELAACGAPGVPEGVGMHLVAPTVLEHGDLELKQRFLRPTVTGQLTWCQLFSEPGAGSDLAGLTTHARCDGDEWLVRGQKVWTTSAAHADLGLLLARTDRDAPKHQGITCFLIPMRQDGVEVRPLRQMNGHASFNEVFFDDAVVPAGHVLGEVNGGWRVARTTLAHERRMAILARGQRPRVHASGRAVTEAFEEHERVSEPYRWYPQRAGRVDLLASQAADTGARERAVVRDGVAALLAFARLSTLTSERAASARARGRSPGPEGSLGKLASSHVAKGAARLHAEIAGASAMLASPDAPCDGVIAEVLVSVPAVSIAGGTDEIQRSIIGERVLSLPREPDLARDVPFSQIATDSTTAMREGRHEGTGR